MKFFVRFTIVICFIIVFLALFFFIGVLQEHNGLEYNDNDYIDLFNYETESDGEKFLRMSSTTKFLSFNQRINKHIRQYMLTWNHVLNGTDPWQCAASWPSARQVYRESPSELGFVLNAMAKRRITSADVGYRGTQLKLTLVIDGQQSVVFKPRWYDRDFTVEGLPYHGHDRHNGEIVAFHMSRLLGLNRVPIAVGRTVDLETEILPVATERLRNTFFTNESNTCFYGKCLYCKNQASGVCANGTKLEGALILWLPKTYQFDKFRHPWARTYRPGKKARWEQDDNYCDVVRQADLYSTGPLLMDIIDTCVFDFIIGNADRHGFEAIFNDSSSMLIMFDNGKSFGNAWHDELTILAPLHQCRQIRASTVHKLQAMAGRVLSRVLRQVIADDPISPLLSEAHFEAVDRRLAIVIHTIDSLIRTAASDKVLVDDGYS